MTTLPRALRLSAVARRLFRSSKISCPTLNYSPVSYRLRPARSSCPPRRWNHYGGYPKPSPDDVKRWYDLLELSYGADKAAIRTKTIQFNIDLHPDRNAQTAATSKLGEVGSVVPQLTDPESLIGRFRSTPPGIIWRTCGTIIRMC